MKTILLAGGLSMVLTLLGTRWWIGVLVRHRYGQYIRDDLTGHQGKRGTPTMGGVIIIGASVLGYLLAHLLLWTPVSVSALLILGLFIGMGFVGFLDDWLKIRKKQSLGLNARAKLIGQTLVSVAFGWAALHLPDERGVTPASAAISFLRDIPLLHLWAPLAVLWIVLLIAGFSNAVNLTDGLDGLATGSCAAVFAAYAVINIWQYNQSCASIATAGPKCYEVRDPYDLAVVALAIAGACFGFLWWNASPAKIFMGDSGSLSLGAALAGLAIFTRTELLLVILGGLFVLITLSVVLQVGWFKLSKGKRLFKMAPLHHHFEMVGWADVTIVVRFWIVACLGCALGLGIFYAEWVSGL